MVTDRDQTAAASQRRGTPTALPPNSPSGPFARGGSSRMTRVNFSSGTPFEDSVGYSRAVRVGPLVVVAGTTAAGDDLAAQTREVFRRIEVALAQADATLSDVVRT